MTLLSNYWTLASFSLTVISAPYWPWMPNWFIALGLLIALSLSLLVNRCRGCIGIALALLVIITQGNLVRAQSNIILQFDSDITIKGEVNSFFNATSHGFSGSAVVRSINHRALPFFLTPKIRLSAPIELQPGDQFEFLVQVKPIYGRLNEVGFDLESYYLSQRWVARANVKANSTYQVISNNHLRSKLYSTVKQLTEFSAVQGIILALTFGERSLITEQQWLGLRNSGLIHLTAISGLHIGMAFGVGYGLGLLLSRIVKRGLWLPFLLGGVVALGYAWLAGFTLPTQRALIMCWLTILLLMLHIKVTATQRILLTLAAVLLWDPFTALTASFWLSFLAVSLVIYQISTLNPQLIWWKKALWGQCRLAILMIPMSAYFFAGVSLSSVLYNILFIPWFSVVVIPVLFLALLGYSMFQSEVSWWWQWVDWALWPLHSSLNFSEQSWLDLSLSIQYFLLLLLILWFFRPILTLRAWVAIGCIMGAMWICLPDKKSWRVDVLDVGHGLAVLIERNNAFVLYDTGSSWQGGSYAQSLVAPLLLHRGATALDGVIISHLDNDHAGGLNDIQRLLSPSWIRASQKREGFRACIQGESWQWQGLTFTALWPPRLVQRAENPHSCVVRVEEPEYGHSLLLTGDVTAIGEWLLSREPAILASDVMLVPHHGSQTSSTLNFIQRVSPQLALASLAKGHRWQLPHPEVLARYQALGIDWQDTGESGQLSLLYHQGHRQLLALRKRGIIPWYRQMLRNEVE
ncbi:DNA internalization-related competence protein ComEC/Rec2 [Vibrio fujianensis]|uniref:DNA internalization-related competence protein ComEC/Rec2 n=1 Tax=Vibrio fujianensis TaxID=1974215 RepID=UPI000C16F1A1|nr:DNA internalization-related competence protein ComEC/Rec2 [Vibrio fujianensis]